MLYDAVASGNDEIFKRSEDFSAEEGSRSLGFFEAEHPEGRSRSILSKVGLFMFVGILLLVLFVSFETSGSASTPMRVNATLPESLFSYSHGWYAEYQKGKECTCSKEHVIDGIDSWGCLYPCLSNDCNAAGFVNMGCRNEVTLRSAHWGNGHGRGYCFRGMPDPKCTDWKPTYPELNGHSRWQCMHDGADGKPGQALRMTKCQAHFGPENPRLDHFTTAVWRNNQPRLAVHGNIHNITMQRNAMCKTDADCQSDMCNEKSNSGQKLTNAGCIRNAPSDEFGNCRHTWDPKSDMHLWMTPVENIKGGPQSVTYKADFCRKAPGAGLQRSPLIDHASGNLRGQEAACTSPDGLYSETCESLGEEARWRNTYAKQVMLILGPHGRSVDDHMPSLSDLPPDSELTWSPHFETSRPSSDAKLSCSKGDCKVSLSGLACSSDEDCDTDDCNKGTNHGWLNRGCVHGLCVHGTADVACKKADDYYSNQWMQGYWCFQGFRDSECRSKTWSPASCASDEDCQSDECNKDTNNGWLNHGCVMGKCHHGTLDARCKGIANRKRYPGMQKNSWCFDGFRDSECTSSSDATGWTLKAFPWTTIFLVILLF